MHRERFVENADIRPIALLQESMELIRDKYWLFVGMGVLVILSSYVPFGLFVGPLICGFFLCFFRLMSGQNVEIDHLFKGFDFFLESLIISVLIAVGSYVVTMAIYLLMVVSIFGGIGLFASGEGWAAGTIIIMVVLSCFIALLAVSLVSILFVFSYPILVDRGLRAIEAMTLSMHAVKANLGGILLLLIVNAGITFLAFLICYIPVFLVFPVTFGSFALAYRKVFPQ